MPKQVSIDRMYSRGRQHPHGRNPDHGAQRIIKHEPDMRPDDSEQYCQSESDHHGPTYSNDVPESSWLRGGGRNAAEGKPNFDFSSPRSKMRR